MNKKGFTLVELIGIVVILSMIFLVSYPNFVALSKNENNKQYELMVKDLCLAGESYIYATGEEIEIGNTILVNISDLVSNGYVDKNLKDVKTGESVSTKKLKYTVNSDKTLDCKYQN